MLYKKDSKGKMRFWKAYTSDDFVITEHGVVGGKCTSTSYQANPTNEGRSNYRNSYQQADFEVESLYNKKRDSGYFDTVEQAENEILIRPMLAHVYQDHKDNLGEYVYVQPKLNGVRCLAFPDGTLMSRKGKVYKVPHISEAVKEMKFPDSVIALDGELFVYDESLGDIQSAAKTGGMLPNGTPIQYHVYDVVEHRKAFSERIDIVFGLCENVRRVYPVITVKNVDVNKVDCMHDSIAEMNYEGVMVRDPNSLYEIGKRSYSLLKYKKFKDDEFEIVSVYPDKAGNAMFVIWDHVAKVKHDVKYGTHIFGRDCLNGKIDVIGKKMTVKYQSRLPDTNIMEFATGVNIRDDYS